MASLDMVVGFGGLVAFLAGQGHVVAKHSFLSLHLASNTTERHTCKMEESHLNHMFWRQDSSSPPHSKTSVAVMTGVHPDRQ